MQALSGSMLGSQRLGSMQSLGTTDAAPLQCPQIARRPSRCGRLVTQMSRTAAPATLPVKTASNGSEAGTSSLTLKVADPEKAKGLVHRHVIKILQNQRQGSANTKTRSEVRGGGRKPFAQKGTGNARMGSKRSPLLPGGGVIFGPKPKDWSIKMNKKERRLAIATALQSAAAAQDVTVVDDIKSQISEIKTKFLVKLLAGLGFDLEKQHVLLIVDELTIELQRSGRNIPNLVFNKSSALNTYDILRADKIVVDKASLEFINEFFGPSEATA